MPADLSTLRARFARDGVTIDADPQGLAYVAVATPVVAGRLYLQGAHVTHYQPAGATPLLFLSKSSYFHPGKPIRGGVPVVFPWFGPHPSDPTAPAHGWARTSAWDLRDVRRDADGTVAITLSLVRAGFTLTYNVHVGPRLDLQLTVRNESPTPATFEEALHTYLAVGDARRVRVEGLDGRTYLDKMEGSRRKTQAGAITLAGETDRVYVDTPDTVTVHDLAAGRRVVVSKEGSATTVLWNPWVEKSKRMVDFGDDEWPSMLCVETANAAGNAVTLRPGGQHTLRATIGVE